MFAELVVLFSAVVVALLVVKRPLTLCYRQVKMRIWHRFTIWKLERRIEKSSNQHDYTKK